MLLQQQAVELPSELLGPGHAETLSAIANLAEIQRLAGPDEPASEGVRQVIETRSAELDADHPDRVLATNNLAASLYSQGDLEGSRDLFRQVLEVRTRDLGERHPLTLATVNNLCAAMIGLGRHAEAAKLLEGCLERSRESLGAQHPETFKAAWQLLIAESRGRDARGRVRELFANDLSPLMQCAPERLPPETAAAIKQAGIARVGLLGTRFTMEQDFYRGRLAERHGIEVLIPAAKDRDLVHRVIYEELCLGLFDDASRTAYLDVMARLVTRGAEAIILGCTEISLLVGPRDTDIPLFDTTAIHARAAAERAFRGER